MNTKNKIIKIVLTLILICIAVGFRVINHNYNFAPNLELITTVTVLAAIIIGWKAAIVVPLLSVILSDLIIGNSLIFMFTWGAFILIGLGSILLRKYNKKPIKQVGLSLGFAITSSFVFFVVTNFGVWVQGWYPATMAGLIQCFTMAIPFYRTMLIGNMILVPCSVAILNYAKSSQTIRRLVINPFISK